MGGAMRRLRECVAQVIEEKAIFQSRTAAGSHREQ